tara:strand:- start:1494 stop:1787 length:294 start_codon:yes stop_codon:yes gene_type:complete
MWWTIFVVSLLLNVFFIWYVRNLLIRFNFLGDNINDFTTQIQEYSDHLFKVGEMDVYVGDPTILGLMKHTKDLQEFIKEYEETFLLDQEEQDEETAA